jgi:hypothetical protein
MQLPCKAITALCKKAAAMAAEKKNKKKLADGQMRALLD